MRENFQLEVNWLQSLKSDDDNSHKNEWLLDQIQVVDIMVAGFYRQRPKFFKDNTICATLFSLHVNTFVPLH